MHHKKWHPIFCDGATKIRLVVEVFRKTSGLDPLQLFAEAIESHCGAGLLEMVQGHLRLAPGACRWPAV